MNTATPEGYTLVLTDDDEDYRYHGTIDEITRKTVHNCQNLDSCQVMLETLAAVVQSYLDSDDDVGTAEYRDMDSSWNLNLVLTDRRAEPSSIIVDLYGRPTECRMLENHGTGTIDVERISDGKCFRVSGLSMA